MEWHTGGERLTPACACASPPLARPPPRRGVRASRVHPAPVPRSSPPPRTTAAGRGRRCCRSPWRPGACSPSTWTMGTWKPSCGATGRCVGGCGGVLVLFFFLLTAVGGHGVGGGGSTARARLLPAVHVGLPVCCLLLVVGFLRGCDAASDGARTGGMLTGGADAFCFCCRPPPPSLFPFPSCCL